MEYLYYYVISYNFHDYLVYDATILYYNNNYVEVDLQDCIYRPVQYAYTMEAMSSKVKSDVT